jgi:hypothetical protein
MNVLNLITMLDNFQLSRRRNTVHGKTFRGRRGLRGVRPKKLNHDEGVIIVLVAVFMLGAVGAMAALSIDVITLYTARSEAQLTADAGALAAARALANSGATSDPSGNLMTLSEPLASKVAIQVAQSSFVGGRYLDASKGEVVVSFSDSQNNPCTALHPITNPCVTVAVQRTDLPTFFARIWGANEVKVATSATAEAYNPTNVSGGGNNPNPPVAPICVKPWLLPNIDPTAPTGTPTIFDPISGAVTSTTLLGFTPKVNSKKLRVHNVSAGIIPWRAFPSDSVSFPAPPEFPTCAPSMATAYQQSVAGCVQTPIVCNAQVNIQPAAISNSDTANAVNCLTHASNSNGDSISPPPTNPQTVPFEFSAGSDNPIPNANGNDVMVSDSLVTVPVVNIIATTPWPPTTTQFQIIGFAQLFLNSDGNSTSSGGGPNGVRIFATVVNLVGCGSSATGTPIFGNGASPVAVRLVSP